MTDTLFSAKAPRPWGAGPVDEIIAACATGLREAIVTNPHVLAAWFKADGRAPEATAAHLVQETGRPAFLQLLGPDTASFLRQAEAIQALSPLLLPKLPATATGLAATALQPPFPRPPVRPTGVSRASCEKRIPVNYLNPSP